MTESTDEKWEALSALHSGHPALDEETVYVLPNGLAEIVADHVPGLFTDDELAFEQDLSATMVAAFFCGRGRLISPLIPKRHNDAGSSEPSTYPKVLPPEVWDAWYDWLSENGMNAMEIDRYLQMEDRIACQVNEARWGYAAWLVLNPRFRSERDGLHDQWSDEILVEGRFPRFPVSLLGGERSDQPDPQSCSGQFHGWYGRWSLETMATWEVPIPMWTMPTLPTKYYGLDMRQSGLVLHVPWYLLRDRKLSLHDLARHSLSDHTNDDLREFIGGAPKGWGNVRLVDALRLHVIWDLVLAKRYPNRIEGNVQRLELALGKYWREAYGRSGSDDSNAESLRRIRRFIRRHLEAV